MTMTATTPEVRTGWHRHPNGGGWVKDTATVDAAAYVGPKATIWGGVIHGGNIYGGDIHGGNIYGGDIWGGTIWGGDIYGGSIHGGVIQGGSIHGGGIWGGYIYSGVIHGGVIHGGTIHGGNIWNGDIWGGYIDGGDIKESPLQIQGTRSFVTETWDGKIQIGCTEMTLAEWRLKGPALARSERFTPAQVAEYTRYLYLFECLRPELSAETGANPVD